MEIILTFFPTKSGSLRAVLKGNGGLEKKKIFAAKSWIRSLTCQKSKN